MELMKYKDFAWPNNPRTYRETVTREPKYVTKDGVTSYTGISSTRRVITGTGEFFGEEAYERFRELIAVAEESTAGELYHPTWGKRYCYLTKLELTQEPRADHVAYSFEFLQAKSDGTVPV